MNETPSYLDPQPDCVCGHEWADHREYNPDDEFDEAMECIKDCNCAKYRPKDAYYYEELRQEAELARWEDR